MASVGFGNQLINEYQAGASQQIQGYAAVGVTGRPLRRYWGKRNQTRSGSVSRQLSKERRCGKFCEHRQDKKSEENCEYEVPGAHREAKKNCWRDKRCMWSQRRRELGKQEGGVMCGL